MINFIIEMVLGLTSLLLTLNLKKRILLWTIGGTQDSKYSHSLFWIHDHVCHGSLYQGSCVKKNLQYAKFKILDTKIACTSKAKASIHIMVPVPVDGLLKPDSIVRCWH